MKKFAIAFALILACASVAEAGCRGCGRGRLFGRVFQRSVVTHRHTYRSRGNCETGSCTTQSRGACTTGNCPTK